MQIHICKLTMANVHMNLNAQNVSVLMYIIMYWINFSKLMQL